jgi:hypothetical protein
VRKFINFYVNEEDIRFLGNEKYAFQDGDEVLVIPSIAGGPGRTGGRPSGRNKTKSGVCVLAVRIAGRKSASAGTSLDSQVPFRNRSFLREADRGNLLIPHQLVELLNARRLDLVEMVQLDLQLTRQLIENLV